MEIFQASYPAEIMEFHSIDLILAVVQNVQQTHTLGYANDPLSRADHSLQSEMS